MNEMKFKTAGQRIARLAGAAIAAAGLICSANAAHSQAFTPGNLVVSRSVYAGYPSLITVGQPLPGGGNATNDGTYPGVFGNETPDPSFGITSPIFLDQITPSGTLINTLAVPTSQAVTSISSKSEMGLHLSSDQTSFTFMAYAAPVNTLDVSNSNTPGNFDPTDPVPSSYYRADVEVHVDGSVSVTPVNSYSGNNGRNVVKAGGLYYEVGNAGNGSGTPNNIITDTGVQIATPGGSPSTVMAGVYDVTQNGFPADKAGKDNNFRGITLFNNTLYVTKGSGSNGINTVYQVGNPGVLPTYATAATTPITILPGFNTGLAKPKTNESFPFGIWFANPNTLYVADEGDGATKFATSQGGLQKWSLVNGTWHLDYNLTNGLNIGTKYSIPGYPSSLNPFTDGLRNITGQVNGDGTVTVYGVTSTVSALTDQGADPNKLVKITDTLAFTTAAQAASEAFTTLKTAGIGEVLRGVELTPTPILTDVTASTKITVSSGPSYNPITHLWSATLKVTNTGASPLAGPLQLEFNGLSGGTVLQNATGTWLGVPYITNPVGSLAPGASATFAAQFSHAPAGGFTYTNTVQSGAI